MILVALFIGAILIVAAFRNTQGSLFTALGQDIPAFVVWAAAIVALGAVGFVPGLKSISRGLMTLVLVVIILRNYQNILKGFQSVSSVSTASNASSNSGSSNSTNELSGTNAVPVVGSVAGNHNSFLGTLPDYITPNSFSAPP